MKPSKEKIQSRMKEVGNEISTKWDMKSKSRYSTSPKLMRETRLGLIKRKFARNEALRKKIEETKRANDALQEEYRRDEKGTTERINKKWGLK